MHNPELVLPRLVRSLAREDEKKNFLTEAETGRVASRGQTEELMLRWAGAFRSLGVEAGDTVALMLPTSITALAAWLGIGWLRALEVPVNTQYVGESLRYLLNDSGASIVVVDESVEERVREVAHLCPALSTIVVVGGSGRGDLEAVSVVGEVDFLAQAVSVESEPGPEFWDIAAIVYTSGTTGASKGVLIPWGQLYEMSLWIAPFDRMDGSDVGYVPYPFYHITVKSPVYLFALLGGSLVIREKLSVSNYWDEIKKHRVTYTNLLGVMVNMLMLEPRRSDDADNPLRLVGVVPRGADVAAFEDRFGVETGTIFNMTETSVPFANHTRSHGDPTSCGRVRAGLEVRLVDDHDQEVGTGEVGELIVRADEPWTLNAGYWNKPAETAAAWRNGWFHTGDAFRRNADGEYFFVDRKKDALRRRGENVSSMEVEALIRANDKVAEVAVVGVPAEIGDEEILALVVLAPGETLSYEELAADLAARLPAFMIPRYLEFQESLPKTPTYKIRKVELRSRGVTPDTWDRVATGARTPTTPSS